MGITKFKVPLVRRRRSGVTAMYVNRNASLKRRLSACELENAELRSAISELENTVALYDREKNGTQSEQEYRDAQSFRGLPKL